MINNNNYHGKKKSIGKVLIFLGINKKQKIYKFPSFFVEKWRDIARKKEKKLLVSPFLVAFLVE
jgi:hypothetical protein